MVTIPHSDAERLVQASETGDYSHWDLEDEYDPDSPYRIGVYRDGHPVLGFRRAIWYDEPGFTMYSNSEKNCELWISRAEIGDGRLILTVDGLLRIVFDIEKEEKEC